MTELGQIFGPADRKSTLIQLASAALVTRSFSQDIDEEDEEEGPVGGMLEDAGVRVHKDIVSASSPKDRSNGDVKESEKYIDKVAAKVQLLRFFFFMNGNTERAQSTLSRVCIP